MTTAVIDPPEALDDDRDDQVPAVDVDPDAPYGRNPRTGLPYKRSPQWRAGLAEALQRGRATQAGKAPPRKAASRKTSAGTKASTGTDYRQGVAALLQIPAFALGVVGRYRPAYALDAAALTLHTPTLADAVHQTALSDERVAAILDRVLAAGPYGALLGALMPLALQIAANHKAIPPVAELGILTPDQLVEALHKQAP
jgi:hypothetical protein